MTLRLSAFATVMALILLGPTPTFAKQEQAPKALKKAPVKKRVKLPARPPTPLTAADLRSEPAVVTPIADPRIESRSLDAPTLPSDPVPPPPQSGVSALPPGTILFKPSRALIDSTVGAPAYLKWAQAHQAADGTRPCFGLIVAENELGPLEYCVDAFQREQASPGTPASLPEQDK